MDTKWTKESSQTSVFSWNAFRKSQGLSSPVCYTQCALVLRVQVEWVPPNSSSALGLSATLKLINRRWVGTGMAWALALHGARMCTWDYMGPAGAHALRGSAPCSLTEGCVLHPPHPTSLLLAGCPRSLFQPAFYTWGGRQAHLHQPPPPFPTQPFHSPST